MKIARILVAAALGITMLTGPALAGSRDVLRDGPGEDGRGFPPVVDFVLTRPFGLGCIGGGIALAVALSPFNALADLGRPGIPYLKASSRLVVDPVRYTFMDRLGSH